ncbi:hypothetical protein ABEQ65_13155, partial [Cutibacterium acnes]
RARHRGPAVHRRGLRRAVARDGGPVMSACIEPDACPHDGEIDVETYGCNAWRVCGDCGEILDSAAWWDAGL